MVKMIGVPDREERDIQRKKRVYSLIKRALDVLVSLAALAALCVPMLMIMLLIRIADGRPAIYRQQRLGKGGRLITIYKFRSMCVDADQQLALLPPELQRQYQQEFKIENDPRMTSLGSFLRRTSLDELPQLFNILRGDLSLVGPRPILPEELACYKPGERELFLSVMPGLTGYWQAYAAPEDTYVSGRRQQMELHYEAQRSLLFDLRIFMKTFATVLRKATYR